MPLNPEKIREDFPLLARRNVTYLDNAATTQKPRQVIEAIKEFYEAMNANVHRGLHKLSQEASEAYEEAHEVVAKFIAAKDWRSVSFTRNATEALNIVAQAIAEKYLRAGDEVVVTVMEHNSNILPWVRISRLLNLKLKVVGLSSNQTLNYDELLEAITRRTKVVALTHISNVLGVLNDVKKVVREASQVGTLVVLDAAQSAPHIPLNVGDLGVDALAFSGHKMLGPTGIGVLYLRPELAEELPPPILGGGMVREVEIVGGEGVRYETANPPWKFEAGTPNIAGAVGLAEAVKYLTKLGMSNVEEHSRRLAEYAVRRLREEIEDYITIYGPTGPSLRIGIVSFNVIGANPHLVASMLDSEGVAVRSGFHCAQHLHYVLGAWRGSVRASFYIYNTVNDVDTLVNALKRTVEDLKGIGVIREGSPAT